MTLFPPGIIFRSEWSNHKWTAVSAGGNVPMQGRIEIWSPTPHAEVVWVIGWTTWGHTCLAVGTSIQNRLLNWFLLSFVQGWKVRYIASFPSHSSTTFTLFLADCLIAALCCVCFWICLSKLLLVTSFEILKCSCLFVCLFHLTQTGEPKEDGCCSTIVSITFLLLRSPGKKVEMTASKEVQTWWLSTAKKNRYVYICVFLNSDTFFIIFTL